MNIIIPLAIAAAFGLSACEVNTPAGPAGPAGEKGTSGAVGAKGNTGDPAAKTVVIIPEDKPKTE